MACPNPILPPVVGMPDTHLELWKAFSAKNQAKGGGRAVEAEPMGSAPLPSME
jgi:hypothetical protein